MTTLTKSQRTNIERIAAMPDVFELYAEQSISGFSMTLRYKRATKARYSGYETHLIFSVDLLEYPNPTPAEKQKTAERLALFEARKTEAIELFQSLRTKSGK